MKAPVVCGCRKRTRDGYHGVRPQAALQSCIEDLSPLPGAFFMFHTARTDNSDSRLVFFAYEPLIVALLGRGAKSTIEIGPRSRCLRKRQPGLTILRRNSDISLAPR